MARYHVIGTWPGGTRKASADFFYRYEDALPIAQNWANAGAQVTINTGNDVVGHVESNIVDGNPGGIDMDNVIDSTIGSTDHQFVIEQTDGGYWARYGNKSHNASAWNHYPPVEFGTRQEAVEYAERFLGSAQGAIDAMFGNPDGVETDPTKLEWSDAWKVTEPTPEEQTKAEEMVAGMRQREADKDHALGTRVTTNRGETLYAPSMLEAAEFAAEERALLDGNPGGEPLHESLSNIVSQVGYEAEVVAAAAAEVEDPDVAAAAEKQAKAMDAAAEELETAAEAAAETAAEIFSETGVSVSEVAQTDTPEGDVVSGNPETPETPETPKPEPDVAPESTHWYTRHIGAHS